MKTITCQIESLIQLTPHVYKALLKPSERISFIAGQYLNVVMDDNDKRPFSIASSPNSALIELQIGAFVADSYPMQVIDRLKKCQSNDQSISIEIPLGNAQIRTKSERPLILLAGGTGFSYIKSIFEYLAEKKSTREIQVYWGLREESACYELEETQRVFETFINANFIPVIENPTDTWKGRTGLVHQDIMQDISDFKLYDIYMAGPFKMVEVIRDDFVAQGGMLEHMYADAFAYI